MKQKNAKPDVETIEKYEYDIKRTMPCTKAELDGVTQLLLAKDSLISKLRGDVVDAGFVDQSDRTLQDEIASRHVKLLHCRRNSNPQMLALMP